MKIKFEKKSYYIRLYRELKEVDGVVGTLFGKEVGIHKQEHVGWRRRKYDYVLTDLATGLAIIIRARKGKILSDIENDEPWLDKYKNIFNEKEYLKHLREYEYLKKGGVRCF